MGSHSILILMVWLQCLIKIPISAIIILFCHVYALVSFEYPFSSLFLSDQLVLLSRLRSFPLHSSSGHLLSLADDFLGGSRILSIISSIPLQAPSGDGVGRLARPRRQADPTSTKDSV